MNKINYINLEEFTKNANFYYEQAKAGEKIVVTIEGIPKYEVHADIESASSILSEAPRPKLNPKQFAKLIDLLDPLDSE